MRALQTMVAMMVGYRGYERAMSDADADADADAGDTIEFVRADGKRAIAAVVPCPAAIKKLPSRPGLEWGAYELVVLAVGGAAPSESRLAKMARDARAALGGRPAVEVFSVTELAFDIGDHVLVPRVRLLDAAERDDVLDRYGLKTENLPMLPSTDVLARYLGLKPDDVVHVVHPSDGGNPDVSYWRVV